MKTQYISIIILFLVFTSCKDEFLDLPPETFVTSDTFYTSPENFEQAVNGIYGDLQELYEEAYIFGEMRSDNSHYIYKENDRGGQNLRREDIDGFIDDAENNYTSSKYSNAYEGISKANVVLTRIKDVEFDPATEDRIRGQALFLRAFYYFDLVQFFGGVPLYTEEVTSRQEAFRPRSTEEEVYNQIIADATEAASLLPVSYSSSADLGRVTKGAAHMLLGYVNMTLKNYAAAEEVLQPLLSMGYDLLTNYEDVFSTANKNSVESIFEVQYQQGNQGVNSNWTYIFIPATTDTEPITGLAGNNQLIGGWNTPTQDLIDSYEAGDERKNATIAESYVDAEGNTINEAYTKKFLNPHSSYNNTDDNWPVYRFADALLLLAESLIEQNKTSAALPHINRVRNRAGLTNIETTDQNALRDIIAHERRVELAFENHRWLDLVRTDKAIEVMNAHGAEMKAMHNYLLDITYQVDENKLLFPIPRSELFLNDNLTQNPGY